MPVWKEASLRPKASADKLCASTEERAENSELSKLANGSCLVEPAKGKVEVVVIDHIDLSSEN
jgi:hypothetical protein